MAQNEALYPFGMWKRAYKFKRNCRLARVWCVNISFFLYFVVAHFSIRPSIFFLSFVEFFFLSGLTLFFVVFFFILINLFCIKCSNEMAPFLLSSNERQYIQINGLNATAKLFIPFLVIFFFRWKRLWTNKQLFVAWAWDPQTNPFKFSVIFDVAFHDGNRKRLNERDLHLRSSASGWKLGYI